MNINSNNKCSTLRVSSIKTRIKTLDTIAEPAHPITLRVSSIKTRIKTCNINCLILHNKALRVSSIKTRIKTGIAATNLKRYCFSESIFH